MWKQTILCGILLLVTRSTVVTASRFVVEKASLRVFVGGEKLGDYDAALGDFGFPLYGRVLAGQVLYNDDDSSKSCREIGMAYTSDDASADGKLNSTTVPVALVERGGCFFAEKAYYAEKAGAKAVLIMDNKVEPLLTMSKPQSSEELQSIVDAVTVPTVLIAKKHGEAIIKSLADGDDVIVEFDFRDAMPNPDDRVEWELWGTSSDRCGTGCDTIKALHKSFVSTAVYLERLNYTQFTPYFTFDRRCFVASDDECSTMCIRGGRYCVPRLQLSQDPRYNADVDQDLPSYSGQDVAYENLRQLCLFEQLEEINQPWLWWKYVSEFAQRCTMDAGSFTRLDDASCSDKVLEDTLHFSNNALRPYSYSQSFKMKDFDECASIKRKKGKSSPPSRYVDVDEPHPLLERQLAEQLDKRETGRGVVSLLPTVVINRNQYRGRIQDNTILSTLCSGFSENDEPAACMNEKFEVNECRDGTDSCWRRTLTKTARGGSLTLTACVDTFRGFECTCPAGWAGDGFECTDIDECANGDAECDHDCRNTLGGYTCSCEPGFRLVGQGTCIFTNHCLPSNGGCEERCIPVPDAAKCACSDGLELAPDGKRCNDVDECATGLASCEQLCINKDPRTDDLGRKYACACEPEYVLNMTDPSFRKCVKMTAAGSVVVAGSQGSHGRNITQTFMIAMGSTTILLLSALVAVLMYRRRMQRDEMSQEVRNIMKDYISLSGDEKDREAAFGIDNIDAYVHQGPYASSRFSSPSKSPSSSPNRPLAPLTSSSPPPSTSSTLSATGATHLMASSAPYAPPASVLAPPPLPPPPPPPSSSSEAADDTNHAHHDHD